MLGTSTNLCVYGSINTQSTTPISSVKLYTQRAEHVPDKVLCEWLHWGQYPGENILVNHRPTHVFEGIRNVHAPSSFGPQVYPKNISSSKLLLKVPGDATQVRPLRALSSSYSISLCLYSPCTVAPPRKQESGPERRTYMMTRTCSCRMRAWHPVSKNHRITP